MQTISYTSLRQNLSAIMDKVCESREVLQITRKGHESMIMISESDFNSIQETLHLLSNPHNAAWLRESIKQAEEGKLVEYNWDED